MDGIWLEDGTFEIAKGAKGKFKRAKGLGKGKDGKGKKGKGKGKGKGKDGKGKGKDGDEPDAKRQKLEEEEPEYTEEEKFDWDWKGKTVCLINLKAASLNGCYGVCKEFDKLEEIMVDGKKVRIKRFLITLEGGKGDKSIKFENLFKVMTGSLVKLRGLDSSELNDTVGECGRLDAATMRYDVTLSDGRHIKVKPSNVDFVARYENSSVAGTEEHMEWIRCANGLSDRLQAIEEFSFPPPQVVPAEAVAVYAKTCPKSVVIGRSNAANPKGCQVLQKAIMSSLRAPPNSRLIFISMPRDNCVAPKLEATRHDDLLRLGKFADWVMKRCAPRPVMFIIPGVTAKGPQSTLTAATCAWPLYVELCTDMVYLECDRWMKSPWARMDALLAVWARKPLYMLPEKYQPPMEMPDAAPKAADEEEDEDAWNSALSCPLSFRPEEPLTIERPADGNPSATKELKELAARAEEAEGAGIAKVQKPCLAMRRL